MNSSSKEDVVNQRSGLKQVSVKIAGIDVSFPHEPYDVQIKYIEKLMECLKTGQNGLLESPTGTGKTLSLLCGSLAWLEKHKALQQAALLTNNDPLTQGNQLSSNPNSFLSQLTAKLSKVSGSWDTPLKYGRTNIIYSSRTHSQLSQVVQELKKTTYKHVPSVVLGSRDQMCLLPEVAILESHSAKLHACRSRVKNRSCPFYLNVDEKLSTAPDFQKNAVMDIEDLVKLGRKHTCCPYYTARELKKKAEIIFTPYNYLIDPNTRQTLGIELENNVIIFDEGHNIENVCEESMSFNLKSKDLAYSITEVTSLMEKMSRNLNESMDFSPTGCNFSLDDLASLKTILTELESELDKLAIGAGEKGIVKDGKFIIEVFSKVGLTPSNATAVGQLIQDILTFISSENSSFNLVSKGGGLSKMANIFSLVFLAISNKPGDSNKVFKDFDKDYKIFIQGEITVKQNQTNDFWNVPTGRESNQIKTNWSLNGWCLSANRSIHNLMEQNIHCMILTSGTLAPLNTLTLELGIPFPVTLENPHVIDKNQVFVAVVEKGPDGTSLLSTYKNREEPKYLKSLGMAMSNFCQIVPKGALAVFPSYSTMDGCINNWKQNDAWNSLSRKKSLFIEPRGKESFNDCMNMFNQSIEDPNSKGGLLLAVCRGKISEGLDFTDDNARAVIVTGVPFAPIFDKKVLLKKEYLNANRHKGINGDQWYMLQAIRAVNQAVGRVIRHRHDFGAILLCDNRFSRKEYSEQLSAWVKSQLQCYPSFGQLQRDLCNFYKIHRDKNLVVQTQPNPLQDLAISNNSTFSSKIDGNFTSLKPNNRSNQSYLEMYGPSTSTSCTSIGAKRKSSIFDEMEEEVVEIDAGVQLLSSQKPQQPILHSKVAAKKRCMNVAPISLEAYNQDCIKSQQASLLNQQEVKAILKRIKTDHGVEGTKRLALATKESVKTSNVEIFANVLLEMCKSFPITDRKNVYIRMGDILPSSIRQKFFNLVRKHHEEESMK